MQPALKMSNDRGVKSDNGKERLHAVLLAHLACLTRGARARLWLGERHWLLCSTLTGREKKNVLRLTPGHTKAGDEWNWCLGGRML